MSFIEKKLLHVGQVLSLRKGTSAIFYWATAVSMLLSIEGFECLYTVFGKAVLQSEIKVAALFAMHMSFFSIFQLFSGTLIDHYGGRVLMPLAAMLVLLGMAAQTFVDRMNLFFLSAVPQVMLTAGASYSFVGIGHISNCFFAPQTSCLLFGCAQMLYSMFYAAFWAIAPRYEAFLNREFKYFVSAVILLQFCVFLLMTLFARNPTGAVKRGSVFGLRQVLLDLRDVCSNVEVRYLASIGGIAFGIFFAMSGIFLYKLDQNLGGKISVFAWVGFSIGSVLACWIFNHLRNARLVFLLLCLAQCAGIGVVLLLVEKIAVGRDSFLILMSYLVTTIFGVLSGAHMLAFLIGGSLVDCGRIGACYAVINGAMCSFAGIFVLAVTILVEPFGLSRTLLCSSVVGSLAYMVLGYMLLKHQSTKNAK